jgi:hypothetical protein
MADTESSSPAYLKGLIAKYGQIWAYTIGGNTGMDNQLSFLKGRVLVISDLPAYMTTVGQRQSSIHAFINTSVVRAEINCFLEGVTMEVNYIWLKTSDGGSTLSKKFRVMAAGYDDGTAEKAESVKRTIGGGLDYNAGAVYNSWAPTIRVRHNETESDYGDLGDLDYLYRLINPNGTPSNQITFIDHHQTSRVVYMVGSLQKAMMGCKVEGDQAWFMVRVRLVEVVT